MKSIVRLGDKTPQESTRTFAMMERTVEIEHKLGGDPTLLDLIKGTDLRRTVITCVMYASQNFAGNLIANQATFFFQRRLPQPSSTCTLLISSGEAGIPGERAFELNLINSCIGFVANAVAWLLTSWFGRRSIYLWLVSSIRCTRFVTNTMAGAQSSTSPSLSCLGFAPQSSRTTPPTMLRQSSVLSFPQSTLVPSVL